MFISQHWTFYFDSVEFLTVFKLPAKFLFSPQCFKTSPKQTELDFTYWKSSYSWILTFLDWFIKFSNRFRTCNEIVIFFSVLKLVQNEFKRISGSKNLHLVQYLYFGQFYCIFGIFYGLHQNFSKGKWNKKFGEKFKHQITFSISDFLKSKFCWRFQRINDMIRFFENFDIGTQIIVSIFSFRRWMEGWIQEERL